MELKMLSAFSILVVLIGMSLTPYLTQDAFAAEPEFNAFVADDPDDLDNILSNGDTLTITFSEATNATNSGTMTRSEIRANFTQGSDAAVEWGDDFTGQWNSDSTVLTITLNDITNAVLSIGSSTVEGRSSTNISSAAEGTNSELLDATSNPRTLSGNFGLFVASNAGGGDGCKGDCEEPTLGIDSNGKRQVSNGFSYNGHAIDVERYFTPYPLITANVGKINIAEFKIYENTGVHNIRHFTFAFGMDKGEIISNSKAKIELDIDFDGTETVTVTDPENALDNIKVTTSKVSCMETSASECLKVSIQHRFRAPLDFNIVGTDVWDTKRSSWQNYYNHGIEVVGESLNPPKEHD